MAVTASEITRVADQAEALLIQISGSIISIQEGLDAIQSNPGSVDAQSKYDTLFSQRQTTVADPFNQSARALINELDNLYNNADPSVKQQVAEKRNYVVELFNTTAKIGLDQKNNQFPFTQNAITQAKESGDKQAGETGSDPGAPTNTNTDQQNKEYIANEGADDDSGQQTEGQTTGSGNTTDPGETKSSTTQTGKSDTPASKTGEEAPGKRPKNPLGDFASYTYNISLYAITPDAYNAFIVSGRKNIGVIRDAANSGAGAYIIAQSGGVNNENQDRAPGFDLDYYIDDLKITSHVSGKSTGTATNISDFEFTIYEPYGFSFISNLKRTLDAIQAYSKLPGMNKLVNPTRQFFIIGLRFLGYDIDGKLITGQEQAANEQLDRQPGGSSAIFERYFDIEMKDIKFKLDGRTSTYKCSAVSKSPQVGMGLKRGRIDKDTTIVANTVEEAFNGDGEGVLGLMTSINRQQNLMYNTGTIKIPNKYSVKYIGDSTAIQNATIVLPEDLDKSKFPMKATNKDTSNDAAAAKAVPDPTRRNIVFKSDTAILQAISQIIGQSSYLRDALNVVYTTSKEPNPDKKTDNENSPPSKQNISWYNVSTEIKVLGYDDKVGDFAYDITYVIQPYDTPAVNSSYAKNPPRYYGPHKRYDYWYTGKNSEIIKYEMVFDQLYFNVAVAPPPGESPDSVANKDAPVIPHKRQPTARLGKLGVGMEAQNSYITSLYAPDAYKSAKIEILGDPDYLIEDSPSSINQVYQKFYGSDGYTINPNGGQVFLEIDFKEAVDYDNEVGTLTLNESIQFIPYPKGMENDVKGVVFQLKDVISYFRGGKFTQSLDCVMPTFPEGTLGNSAAAAARETDSDTGNRQGTGSATNNANSSNQNTGLRSVPAEPTPTTSSDDLELGSAVDLNSNVDRATQVTTPTNNGVVTDDDATGEPSSPGIGADDGGRDD